MNKRRMLEFLAGEFDEWSQVIDFMAGFYSLNGWYQLSDGPALDDQFLTDEDPRGDLSGAIISKRDFDEFED